MMHDFTPSQIISETFCCLLLSALYLCRGFERVCVVACSAVMWGFCYPAELPELVQIAWILSFCSPNLTKPLTETQRYRRERANESSNLSKDYLYPPGACQLTLLPAPSDHLVVLCLCTHLNCYKIQSCFEPQTADLLLLTSAQTESRIISLWFQQNACNSRTHTCTQFESIAFQHSIPACRNAL